MKETIKASVGGYAFTFDRDAYEALNNYLEDLRSHFKRKNDSGEIIADIEDRMRELLQMKIDNIDGIVTLDDAKDIITIMGNPKDFDEEGSNDTDAATDRSEPAAASHSNWKQKRIYRDTSNAVLGGVLSGLGIYLRLDPVILRVGYVLSIILAKAISGKLSSLLFVMYFVMWVIVPAAKTMSQKLALTGQNPTVEAIESGTVKLTRRRGTGIGRVLLGLIKVFISFILIVFGVTLLCTALAFMFSIEILEIPSLSEIIYVFGGGGLNDFTALIALLLIPALCSLYFGIKIFFRITGKDLLILVVSLVIWVGCCGYFAIKSAKVFKYYTNQVDRTDVVVVPSKSDTLYVQMADVYKTGIPVNEVYSYSFGNKSKRKRYRQTHNIDLYEIQGEHRSWFIRPSVKVVKNPKYTEYKIEINKEVFDKTEYSADQKAVDAHLDYTIQDSLVIISPRQYNVNNLWDRELFDLTIQCPVDKTVVVW